MSAMDEAPTMLAPGPGLDGASIFLLVATLAVFLMPAFLYFPPVLPSKTDAILHTHSPVGLDEDQPNSKQGRGKPAQSRSTEAQAPRIKSLWIYPVKSCKGIELRQSKVLPSGLEFDRLFTFAQLKSPFPVQLDTTDEEKSRHRWEFITQRQFPLLATVKVGLFAPDIIKHKGQPFKTSDCFIVLRFPWQERGLRGVLSWVAAKLARGRYAVPEKEVVLPVTYPSASEIEENGYVVEEVKIWTETVTALNMEAELPRELQLYLGVSNKLGIFRIDPENLREVHDNAPTKEDVGYQPVAHFQDAVNSLALLTDPGKEGPANTLEQFPVNLLNVSSVKALEEKVPKDEELQELSPRRFRPNIIIEGVEAYEEESWKLVRFNPELKSRRQASTFNVCCRTTRCKMPNVDQDKGTRHPSEPDKSLRKLRNVDEGAPLLGCMGMQITPQFENARTSGRYLESWLEVGMGIDVLERGEHMYAK